MKLQLVRMSGRPVSMQNLAEYDAEFKAEYDKILEAHSPDMLTVHQKLKELDEVLNNKWKLVEQQEIPKSAKAWKQLLEQYDCPVMIAQSAEEGQVGKLVMVIMDSQA